MGLEILEWQRCLRPSAPWKDDKSRLPKFFLGLLLSGRSHAGSETAGIVSRDAYQTHPYRPASYENPPFYAERFAPPPPPPNIMEEDNPALAKYLGIDDSKSLFVQNTESVFQEIAAAAGHSRSP